MADTETENNVYGSEFVDAVINNPGGATRTVRFETGRLAQQAAGAVTTYLGDTMLLSATTAPAAWRANRPVSKRTVRVP